MKWTTAQQSAIDAPRPGKRESQTILVAAAAGSGKTAVLVERIMSRLRRHELSVRELLVVTFTNASAAEMRSRIGSKISEEYNATGDEYLAKELQLLSSAHISTLHSFCQWVIRNYFYRLDIDPTFRIGNEGELSLLRDEVLTDVILQAYENNLYGIYDVADMLSNTRSDDVLKSSILRFFSFAVAQSSPTVWLRKIREKYNPQNIPELKESIWGQYFWEEQKKKIATIQGHFEKAHKLGLEYPDEIGAFQKWFEGIEPLERIVERLDKATTWMEMYDGVQALVGYKFPQMSTRAKAIKSADVRLTTTLQHHLKSAMAILKIMPKGVFVLTEASWQEQWEQVCYITLSILDLTEAFMKAYENAKNEAGIVDFNDLEHLCLSLLVKQGTEEHPEPSDVAIELQGIFKEVMVDEYQDTNGVQETIVNLVSRRDNRFYVGDIKQSIYKFRMADPSLFLHKYNTFGSEEKNPNGYLEAEERRIDLSQNFRSHDNILEVTNFIFRQIMTKDGAELDYGDAEALYAGRQVENPPPNWVGGDVEVHLLNISEKGKDSTDHVSDVDGFDFEESTDIDEEDSLENDEKEMSFIAEKIKNLHDEGVQIQEKDGSFRPMQWRDVVILYRNASKSASKMVDILRSKGIPAYTEEKTGYFEAIEVRILLSLLQIIDNPEQDLPMAVVLQSPLVGMDANDMGELRLSGEGTLWQLLPSFAHKKRNDTWIHFVELLHRWRTISRRHEVSHLIWAILEETHYIEYVSAMPNGILRRANVMALYDRAKQFESGSFRGLFRFLRFLESLQESGSDLGLAKTVSEADNVVRIMTIHKSKGLEFPIVFLGKTSSRIGDKDVRNPILFHKGEGIAVKGYYQDLRVMYGSLPWLYVKERIIQEAKAEEERLLYVALTRAKDKLFIVGTIKGEDKLKKFGSKALATSTVPLKGEDIQSANSYLDWIIMALARHLDGGNSIRQASRLEDVEIPSHMPHKECRVTLEIHDSALYAIPEDAIGNRDYERWQLVEAQLPVQAPPLQEEIEKRFNFTYPYSEAVVTPAKISVTEIKRRFAEIEELSHQDVLDDSTSSLSTDMSATSITATNMSSTSIISNNMDSMGNNSSSIEIEAKDYSSGSLMVEAESVTVEDDDLGLIEADISSSLVEDLGSFGIQISSFQSEEALSTGTRWGTLMHEAVQWLPVKNYTTQSMHAELDRLEREGYFTEEERRVLSAKGLLGFYESPLGQRLIASPQVEKELPFSMLMEGCRVYSTLEQGEEVFLQGIIDTVFLENGEWVLVDYKTDRVNHVEELVKRYKIQLSLYKEALETLTNRRVKETYIYSFRHHKAIEVIE